MSIDLAQQLVVVSWRYPYPRAQVFRAIAAGRLLATCGGKMDEFRHDFRVGGRYQYAWGDGAPKQVCAGEYLAIEPDALVRFTWEDGTEAPSVVTATLTTKGAYTHLAIRHEKTPSAERAHDYHQGWTEVLALFQDELDGTTLRLAHEFDAPAGKVALALAKGLLFRHTTTAADFARGSIDFRVGGSYHYPIGQDDYVRGQFSKIAPRELRFTWSTVDGGVKVEDTDVIVYLEELPGGRTRLHLVHDGLHPAPVARSHAQGWREALESFAKEGP